MNNGQAVAFKKLKCGDAFMLELNGAVWIKVRGGFRPGCGGQLHACQPAVIVYFYNPAYGLEAA